MGSGRRSRGVPSGDGLLHGAVLACAPGAWYRVASSSAHGCQRAGSGQSAARARQRARDPRAADARREPALPRPVRGAVRAAGGARGPLAHGFRNGVPLLILEILSSDFLPWMK